MKRSHETPALRRLLSNPATKLLANTALAAELVHGAAPSAALAAEHAKKPEITIAQEQKIRAATALELQAQQALKQETAQYRASLAVHPDQEKARKTLAAHRFDGSIESVEDTGPQKDTKSGTLRITFNLPETPSAAKFEHEYAKDDTVVWDKPQVRVVRIFPHQNKDLVVPYGSRMSGTESLTIRNDQAVATMHPDRPFEKPGDKMAVYVGGSAHSPVPGGTQETEGWQNEGELTYGTDHTWHASGGPGTWPRAQFEHFTPDDSLNPLLNQPVE